MMKKTIFLTTMLCLLAISAFAQNRTTNFSGNWELNTVESKLDERMRVESMTLNVTQNDKELKIQSTTKRLPPPNGEMPSSGGGMNRGGGMGRGGFGDGTVIYNLNGDETKVESNSGMGGSATLKAKFEKDGKLNLTSVRTFNTQNGEMTMTTKETWELAGDGKTLKVSRQMETPRGTNSSELVFSKKDSIAVSDNQTTTDATTQLVPKTVSGGILNSKATNLVKPSYPDAAKAVKAGGAVNVQVTIDEQGNIISAQVVSGHPLLRAASEEAARASKFSPTTLSGVPVQVTGVIVYNFVP